MKFRNLLELIGLHSRTKHYNYTVKDFDLQNGQIIKYAQWLHPSDALKSITNEQVKAYREHLSPGDFCIDIGAHSGDSTLPMAMAVGLNGCVLALEPNPYVYHVLEKNARANQHLVNIKTIMAAATHYEGFIEFEYSDSAYCNGGRHKGMGVFKHGHMFKLNVFGINLTSELKSDYSTWLPKLKFIKTDAEGYDLYIIKSLAEIIDEYRPCIKSEIFKKTSIEYRRELLSFMLERRYDVYKVEKEPLERGRKLGLEDATKWKHYDILCIPK